MITCSAVQHSCGGCWQAACARRQIRWALPAAPLRMLLYHWRAGPHARANTAPCLTVFSRAPCAPRPREEKMTGTSAIGREGGRLPANAASRQRWLGSSGSGPSCRSSSAAVPATQGRFVDNSFKKTKKTNGKVRLKLTEHDGVDARPPATQAGRARSAASEPQPNGSRSSCTHTPFGDAAACLPRCIPSCPALPSGLAARSNPSTPQHASQSI